MNNYTSRSPHGDPCVDCHPCDKCNGYLVCAASTTCPECIRTCPECSQCPACNTVKNKVESRYGRSLRPSTRTAAQPPRDYRQNHREAVQNLVEQTRRVRDSLEEAGGSSGSTSSIHGRVETSGRCLNTALEASREALRILEQPSSRHHHTRDQRETPVCHCSMCQTPTTVPFVPPVHTGFPPYNYPQTPNNPCGVPSRSPPRSPYGTRIMSPGYQLHGQSPQGNGSIPPITVNHEIHVTQGYPESSYPGHPPCPSTYPPYTGPGPGGTPALPGGYPSGTPECPPVSICGYPTGYPPPMCQPPPPGYPPPQVYQAPGCPPIPSSYPPSFQPLGCPPHDNLPYPPPHPSNPPYPPHPSNPPYPPHPSNPPYPPHPNNPPYPPPHPNNPPYPPHPSNPLYPPHPSNPPYPPHPNNPPYPPPHNSPYHSLPSDRSHPHWIDHYNDSYSGSVELQSSLKHSGYPRRTQSVTDRRPRVRYRRSLSSDQGGSNQSERSIPRILTQPPIRISRQKLPMHTVSTQCPTNRPSPRASPKWEEHVIIPCSTRKEMKEIITECNATSPHECLEPDLRSIHSHRTRSQSRNSRKRSHDRFHAYMNQYIDLHPGEKLYPGFMYRGSNYVSGFTPSTSSGNASPLL